VGWTDGTTDGSDGVGTGADVGLAETGGVELGTGAVGVVCALVDLG
jgi:hypothetical protein